MTTKEKYFEMLEHLWEAIILDDNRGYADYMYEDLFGSRDVECTCIEHLYQLTSKQDVGSMVILTAKDRIMVTQSDNYYDPSPKGYYGYSFEITDIPTAVYAAEDFAKKYSPKED